jgi:large subunit ribosomal protein L4e
VNLTTELLKLAGSADLEVPLLSLDGSSEATVKLPKIFNAPRREDLVRRVYISLLTHTLQPKGSSRGSGHKHSVESWGAGYGMARISRIKGRGTQKYMSGGMIPFAVGGRPTHPPVPEKKIYKQVNKREKRLALISALSFTASRNHVVDRGHRLPENLATPLVTVEELESITKTSELERFLRSVGLAAELERCRQVKIRAGKGKMRGRRYKRRVGPLIVVGEDKGVGRAAENIPGVDLVEARNLSVLHLAPGGKPGRLVVFTKPALEALEARIK